MAGVEDIESLAADPAYTRLTVQEAMKNRAEVLAAKAKYHEAYQRLITQGGLVLEKRKAHPWLSDDRVVLAAICGLLIILLIFFLSSSSSPKAKKRGTSTILLVGPTDGGKTAIFTKLAQDERPATHTSTVASTATIALQDGGRTKNLRLVDLPGHARLRDEVDKQAAAADAVVFVVDASTLVRNAASVAEHLPPLLTALAGSSTGSQRPTPLLILAHKSDLLPKNAATERAKSVLTRELERLKTARSAGVGGRIEGMSRVATRKGFWARLFGGGGAGEGDVEVTREEAEALVWGGQGSWRWEDIEGVEVAWAAGSVRDETEGGGLSEMEEWLWDV